MAAAKNGEKRESKDKSRAQYACPPALESMIRKVNEIPRGAVLGHYTVGYLNRVGRQSGDFEGCNTYEELVAALTAIHRDVFDKCFKGFSESFKEKLFQDCASSRVAAGGSVDEHFEANVISDAVFWYSVIKEEHDNLRAIERFFYHLRKNDFQTANDCELITNNEETVLLPLLQVQVRREGTKGKINKTFFESLIGLDLDRIRACEVCNNIFWAKRVDSETCSARCFNTLRARRFRNLTPEEKAAKKAAREANRKVTKNGIAKTIRRNNSNGAL